MKRVILTYAMFLFTLSLSAQTDIVGKVCEADGGKGIEGVFNISANVSSGILKASMLGFESTELT